MKFCNSWDDIPGLHMTTGQISFNRTSQDAWQVLLTASREVNLSVYLTALRSAPELVMIHLSNDFGSSAIPNDPKILIIGCSCTLGIP